MTKKNNAKTLTGIKKQQDNTSEYKLTFIPKFDTVISSLQYPSFVS